MYWYKIVKRPSSSKYKNTIIMFLSPKYGKISTLINSTDKLYIIYLCILAYWGFIVTIYNYIDHFHSMSCILMAFIKYIQTNKQYVLGYYFLVGCVQLIKLLFLHFRIYCRFLFVTSVIMCVQLCLTYQIKGEIPVYLNIIVLFIFDLKGKYYL